MRKGYVTKSCVFLCFLVFTFNDCIFYIIFQWDFMWECIPTRMTLLHPVLLFSTDLHGSSLQTLFSKIEDRDPHPATIMVIKTTVGSVSSLSRFFMLFYSFHSVLVLAGVRGVLFG